MGNRRLDRVKTIIILSGLMLIMSVLTPGIAQASPYVGEIRMFAGNFAPVGWMTCEGQLLQISDYETLFVLIGTTYGGDGQTTFALPDLRGRAPIHTGGGYVLGQTGGTETVTLNTSQIPTHSFGQGSSNAGTTAAPQPGVGPAQAALDRQEINIYSDTAAATPAYVPPIGGNQPHENMQPYLAINYIISMDGIFPAQN